MATSWMLHTSNMRSSKQRAPNAFTCAYLRLHYKAPANIPLHSEAMFEVVTAEAHTPSILFIKDAEKTVLATYERYAQFKKQFDAVTAPVLVIGSSIISRYELWFKGEQ